MSKKTLHQMRNQLVKQYGEPKSLDQLAHLVIKAIDVKQTVLKFAWRMLYSDRVSNSHNCPIDGTTNWYSDYSLPIGYPGFSGRVWICYGSYPESFGSCPFANTFTYPGTGGSGHYDAPWPYTKDHAAGHPFSWDYRFFLDDWPVLKETVLEPRVLNLMQGNPFIMSHNFIWEK